MEIAERSYKKLTLDDLRRLQRTARREFAAFFERNAHLRAPYESRLLAIALCQGAAKHYLDGVNGVKDIDIWFFFRESPGMRFPSRWLKVGDEAFNGFGVHPDDVAKGWQGRQIHVLGRAIESDATDPCVCISSYLSKSKTTTACMLAEKAVIGLWPEELFGKVIWPRGARRAPGERAI